jgi:hypothetical protein
VCLSREKIARTGKKDSLKKSQTVVPVFKWFEPLFFGYVRAPGI